jgi:hypothetical protein
MTDHLARLCFDGPGSSGPGAQLGPRLRSDAGPFDAVRGVAAVVVSHLLATESFVSFDVLGTAHADRSA